jgi:Cu+-exporting ATPase
MATTTLKVEGMTCGACTSAVESALTNQPGVQSVDVSLVMSRAVVKHDPKLFSAEQIQQQIEDRGFDAEVLDTMVVDTAEQARRPLTNSTLAVGGMTCGACTSAVEGAFKNVAGVKSISISLLSERAVIQHDTTLLKSDQLAEIIEDAGFEATLLSSEAEVSEATEKVLASRTLTTTVAIEGMTCGACTSAVESAFKDVEGLVSFNISLLAERAVIVHDSDKLDAATIAESIEDRGFGATILSSLPTTSTSSSSSTLPLKIYGLPDTHSAADLEKSIKAQYGVTSVTINFATSRATVTHNPNLIGIRAIVEFIESSGYNALTSESDDNHAQLESLAKTKEILEWRRAFRTCLTFAIPVLITSMILPMFLPFLDFGSVYLGCGIWLGDVVCLLLTIPVQFGVGRRFYVSAYKSLKHGSPTMDVLVAIGTSTAFFFSVAAMLVSITTPPHSRPGTVFDTSSMLITFVCMGRYLENRAKGKTSKALSQLMSLAPSMATIYADPIAAAKANETWDNHGEKDSRQSLQINADEKIIPTELIEVGDIVLLKPGDKIPADGTVLRGESYVNESMITGEAMPVQKKKGTPLIAGTVNGAGRIDFVVSRAGRDTQLSQIVRLVQEAQTSRAPIQRLADTVAGYFVSIILTLGAATFVAWLILSHILSNPPAIFLESASGGKIMVCAKLCISVIVFACPCALGLATPTAVMVGTGVGAEKGILIKGGATLETATKVNHVLFDKTGTLTIGKMSVMQSNVEKEWSNEKKQKLWWMLVGLAEMGSEHPIAKAIVLAAKEQFGLGSDAGLDGSVGDFQAIVGKGITAFVETALSPNRQRYKVFIGNLDYLKSQGFSIPAHAQSLSPDDDMFESSSAPQTSSIPSTREAGTTVIHLAIDTSYAGSILLSDTLKPSAKATILALRRLGVDASIVTGDSRAPALVVARALGIPEENVHASCTPADKQSLLEKMQLPIEQGGQGLTVAMVGDGINDSPALATASIGIALSSGTDVAMEAASVVLMNSGDLLSVPAALHLSKYIFTRIRLNLMWACGYNLIGLPFAMGFFLPWGYSVHPMAAGGAMAFSSVSVVLSSLALKWWKRPSWMNIRTLDPENAAHEVEEREPGVIAVLIGILADVKSWVVSKVGGRKGSASDARYVPLRDMGDV